MIIRLKRGTLWQEVVARTQTATAIGALHSIETEYHSLQQNGIEFVVRVATNLKRKAQQKQEQKRCEEAFNPFLPPEQELTVADISPTHLSVLNKFNVVDHHLLIVTRSFEHQERLLTLEDFEALWLCLREYPSLGFYNGGVAAGASQRHKHLQLVPLPLFSNQSQYPFRKVYSSNTERNGIRQLEPLPFLHSWRRLPKDVAEAPFKAAQYTLSLYRQMLKSVGIRQVNRPDGYYQSTPYNLLMTLEWMLLVPRSQECCNGISVNALGFVGSLFVKDRNGLDTVRNLGPMNLLQAVSMNPADVARHY
ncbi:MAG: phosphorylase [Candidatus Thiodiazotropha sp. (ex Epidulcina cf. delphinae)]|nr:phosphorylase [Candidatus Thiodiazotropha sp. (ex Epidulcina cf. delphinae)]